MTSLSNSVAVGCHKPLPYHFKQRCAIVKTIQSLGSSAVRNEELIHLSGVGVAFGVGVFPMLKFVVKSFRNPYHLNMYVD